MSHRRAIGDREGGDWPLQRRANPRQLGLGQIDLPLVAEPLQGGGEVFPGQVRAIEVAGVEQAEHELDLFELLFRLGNGHLPSSAEQQGLYLGLTIFKNELSATPYRELLLTVAGRDVRRIRIADGGVLVMDAPEISTGPAAEA